MSMFYGKTELVALARDIFEGNDFEGALRRSNKGFIKSLENKLWETLKEKYPERDFTCGNEALTRSNRLQKLAPILKCKSFSVHMGS